MKEYRQFHPTPEKDPIVYLLRTVLTLLPQLARGLLDLRCETGLERESDYLSDVAQMKVKAARTLTRRYLGSNLFCDVSSS